MLALGLILVLVLGWWFARPAAPASDRLIDGLNGRVRQIVVEIAPLREHFGDYVETARYTESVTRYTAAGLISHIERYRPDNRLDYSIHYLYEDGRLLEESSRGANGLPLYVWKHSYDLAGRLISLTGYNQDGQADFRTSYSYDDQGRLLKEQSFYPDGSLSYEALHQYERRGYRRITTHFSSEGEVDYRSIELFSNGKRLEEWAEDAEGRLQYRVVYRYDSAGNLLEEIAYRADGGQEYRLVNSFDQRGNLLTSHEYDRDNQELYRYSYVYSDRGELVERSSVAAGGREAVVRFSYHYDEVGNWVWRQTERLMERFGEPVFVPIEVTYRLISYY